MLKCTSSDFPTLGVPHRRQYNVLPNLRDAMVTGSNIPLGLGIVTIVLAFPNLNDRFANDPLIQGKVVRYPTKSWLNQWLGKTVHSPVPVAVARSQRHCQFARGPVIQLPVSSREAL